MKYRLLIGGALGLSIGAITGWLTFGSVASGVGIGISLGMAICGVLVAYGYEQQR